MAEATQELKALKGELSLEWRHAKQVWGAAWPLHWIGLTCLFGISTLMAAIATVRVTMNRRKKAVPKFSVVVTLFVFSVTRFLYMLIRPYESNQCLFRKLSDCSKMSARFLYSLGLPSLTSAFMFLHLALLGVMNVRLSKFSNLQNWAFLLSIMSFSYVFQVTITLVVYYHATMIYFLSICQVYFIVWNICLVAVYLYTGIYIANSNQRLVSPRHGSQPYIRQESAELRSKHLKKLTRLILSIAGLGTVFLACQLYSLAAVYIKNLHLFHNPDPWPWFGYENFQRSVETCMAGCLLFVVSSTQAKE